VKERALPDIIQDLPVRDAQEFGQDLAVLGDRLGVAEGFDVPEVQGRHQVFQGRIVDLLELEGLADVFGPLLFQFGQGFL